MMAKRTPPEIRKQLILDAALAVARRTHFYYMERKDVAEEAGVSPPLVTIYFGKKDGLRDAVMAEAVRVEDLAVIAQGVMMKHPRTRRLSRDVKDRALQTATRK